MTTLTKTFEIDLPAVSVRDAIYSRRATREYLTKPVSEKQICALIDSAIRAPSAMNLQPWAFSVVQRPSLLKRISDAAKHKLLTSPEWLHHKDRGHIPLEDSGFDIFYGARTLIVICAKDDPGFSPAGDCYLAGQNLMLAAHEMGLATCPIGLARDVLFEQVWKTELSIPKGYDVVLPIIVGYAATASPETQRAPANILSWVR